MYLRIKKLRENNGLSQKTIAEMLSISRASYTRYETGDLMPTTKNLMILAKYYNTSLDYLAGITDEKKPYPPKK